MSDEIEKPSEASNADLDKLTQVYLRIRDAKQDLDAAHKLKIAELDEQLSLIE